MGTPATGCKTLGREDFILLPCPAANITDVISLITLSYQTFFLKNQERNYLKVIFITLTFPLPSKGEV